MASFTYLQKLEAFTNNSYWWLIRYFDGHERTCSVSAFKANVFHHR